MSTFVPVRVGERLRIIRLARADPQQRLIDHRLVEEQRVFEITRRRHYAEGSQYDTDNDDRAIALNLDPLTQRLPEHERKHAYSTQIGESVQFIADQLAEDFSVEAVDATVQEIIDDALRLSGQLSGTDEDDDVSIEDLLEEVLTAGDVAVQLRWDPVEEAVFYDLWESELVEIEWADRDTIEKVILRELEWVEDESMPNGNRERQVEIRTEWTLEERSIPAAGDGEPVVWLECRRRVWWDDDDEDSPREDVWTGYPVIPWRLLRCMKKGLRGQRGSSIVTRQAMEAADRYNANENIGYIIARRNSHSNLAVVGDAANLKLEQVGHLDRDVDDVLTFPNGTDVTSVSFPTSPEMIEHQRAVLAESIYACFGLTRVEPDTIQGLGQISGYALEILNRKTEGTFRKIRRHFVRDLRSLFATTIDVWEALTVDVDWARGVDQDLPTALDEPEQQQAPPWVVLDEDAPRLDQTMEIRLGSGYVVDDVLLREDYSSGLISRRHALRQRGLSDDDIDDIEKEIVAEKSAAAQMITEAMGGESSRFRSSRGSSTGEDPSDTPTGDAE